jgi:hypothetical protein
MLLGRRCLPSRRPDEVQRLPIFVSRRPVCTILGAVKPKELRAVRRAGGGQQVAMNLLRVPEPWRPLLTVAAAADEVFYRRKHRPRKNEKKHSPASSSQLDLFR